MVLNQLSVLCDLSYPFSQFHEAATPVVNTYSYYNRGSWVAEFGHAQSHSDPSLWLRDRHKQSMMQGVSGIGLYICLFLLHLDQCINCHWLKHLKKNGEVRLRPFFCPHSDSEQLGFIVMQCKCVLHPRWFRQGNKTTIFKAIGNNSLNLMLFLDIGRVFFSPYISKFVVSKGLAHLCVENA